MKSLISLLILVWTLGGVAFAAEDDAPRLRLATTTSTENSGLLDELLPPFETANGVIVDVIAVGTGAALELGRNGDVDVVMVHAPALEEAFVEDGYGVERVGFMYNDFVVLGPVSDPARARGGAGVAEGFAAIASAESLFISRGDNSGTHAKELAVWREADVEPTGEWYREVGQGMGAVITIAANEQAYTLADRGTYLAFRSEIDLAIVLEGDPLLFNPYAIIAISPDRHPTTQLDLAELLIEFVTGSEGQRIIEEFEVNGEQLFVPDA